MIAGVAISTFPYNLDVIAKIISIRDFFITLFFVALGMGVPNPSVIFPCSAIAGAASVFLIASRFVSVYAAALCPAEWPSCQPLDRDQSVPDERILAGHCGHRYDARAYEPRDALHHHFCLCADLDSLDLYDSVQRSPPENGSTACLRRLGIKDIGSVATASDPESEKDIVILGFYRVASSFLHEVLDRDEAAAPYMVGEKSTSWSLILTLRCTGKLRCLWGQSALWRY